MIQNDTEVHEISIDFLDVDDVGMFNFYQFLCFVTRVDMPRDAV